MLFSQQTLDFLVQNRLRNSRDWYLAHKNEYQMFVLAPMTALVERLTPAMLAIDPCFITIPKVNKTISRLHRDTRFSKDKSLYRDAVWCQFSRDKKTQACLLGYYFEVTPRHFSYGCGFFEADTKTMQVLREMIAADDRLFREALAAYQNQSALVLQGEFYKKSRYPGQPEPKRQWLDRKGIWLSHTSGDFDLLFSEDLAPRLAHDFTQAGPVYHLFQRALERTRAQTGLYRQRQTAQEE